MTDTEEYECHECGREWTRNNGRGCPYRSVDCYLCDKHDHSDCDDPNGDTIIVEMQDRIEHLENQLAHYENNCTIVWMIEDVEHCCREANYNRPSKEEGRGFLSYLERKHDASNGISWQTIHTWLDIFHRESFGEENLWPREMPEDYYEEMTNSQDWGDHALNNRGVDYQ